MDDHLETEALKRPIWLRIWQFPLVSMVVALVLVIGVAWLSSLAVEYVIDPNVTGPLGLFLGVISLIALCLIVYKLAIRHLGAKKHDDLPFDTIALRDTVLGFAAGTLLISSCVGLAALFGVYRITGWGSFAHWPEILILTGLYAGFFEELLIRGIVLRWLEELTGSWIALALSSLLFGLLHAGNDNATFFSSFAIAVEAGILLGAAYMLTRSLWLAMGLHAGWNVAQGLWDVPISGNDFSGIVNAQMEGPVLLSGGGFGLEATIFTLVVATGAGIWMLTRAANTGRIVKPIWSRKGQAITAY